MENEIITVLSLLLFMFVEFRWLFWVIIDFQLNKQTRKKRKIGMTFKEWLYYSRYRNEIPPVLIYLYFIIMFSHLIILISIPVCFFFIFSYFYFVNIAVRIMVWIDLSIIFILNFAFRGRKNGKTFLNVDRWFHKGKKK